MISLANPKRNCLLLALIICRCLAFSHSAIDTSKVYKGDFYVDLVSNTDGISGIKAVFTIDASLTEIWGMLNDYHNYKLIYGGIDSLKILEQDKSGILIEFWSDAVIKKIILFYTGIFSKPTAPLPGKLQAEKLNTYGVAGRYSKLLSQARN